jgi:hypothetical protein
MRAPAGASQALEDVRSGEVDLARAQGEREDRVGRHAAATAEPG